MAKLLQYFSFVISAPHNDELGSEGPRNPKCESDVRLCILLVADVGCCGTGYPLLGSSSPRHICFGEIEGENQLDSDRDLRSDP